ncbi:MAG: four helix bundle protein [Flavobacteriaceae bacterium]|nr:four helix bundle protein [Flavobacteriaceae bacterium]
MSKIISHKELKVFQLSFETAMLIFEISKSFPSEEKYSLTDQIRRSSRSVSGNIAEAWRKRRYEKSFVAKLSDSEGEAAETQVWLDYSFACKYINEEIYNELYAKYDHILAILVKMIFNPQQWTLSKK